MLFKNSEINLFKFLFFTKKSDKYQLLKKKLSPLKEEIPKSRKSLSIKTKLLNLRNSLKEKT